MPHGVLFRGNREADIRRNLLRRGLIKGVIGLPANLFYGTGIPACIVVIDKENAVGRRGIFMIDASKGFQKDGAKNRLRERDIHRIVDVFNEQRETLGYARMVPLTEIASEANDYNLNIPRYIDSSEPEDLHDLGAHLHGGIPNRDINALGAYWEVFPGLRELLFSPNGREGYSDARVEADEVRACVLEHGEFKAYGDRVRRVFDGWRREHAPRLRELAVADSPKELIRDLSEDLLHRFAGLPLLDRYDVYQCLMDYWDEVMQDDVYLVVTEGWTEAARPRVLVPVKGKGTAETPDLTVNRKKYRMDLVPPGLVVARYFGTERAGVDRLRTEEEGIARELEEFVEEYSGEDGLLEGATSDSGKVTQAAVRARLKAVAGDPEGQEERDVLEVCLDLMKALAAAKRAAKAAQAQLDSKVLARYAMLTAAEITELVVGDKWMASVEGAIGQVVERLTGGLVDRVRVLEGRYSKPLPALERRVEDYGAKGHGPLGADGGVGMSQEFDFERLVELCWRTHEEARRSASRAIDRSLVVRNWLFGWYIVEYEQSGADRAEYGAQTLKKLSAVLTDAIGRGFSVRYLRQFRRFYPGFQGDSAGARQAADGVFRFRRGDSADIVFRIPGLKGRGSLRLRCRRFSCSGSPSAGPTTSPCSR